MKEQRRDVKLQKMFVFALLFIPSTLICLLVAIIAQKALPVQKKIPATLAMVLSVDLCKSLSRLYGCYSYRQKTHFNQTWWCNWLERPLQVWDVGGSNPSRVIPKTFKVVRAASLLDVLCLKR